MVGFSGVINDSNQNLEELSDNLVWLGSERLFSFKDKNIKFVITLHDSSEDEPPAEANDGDVFIWVWGEIYGHDDGKEYKSKYEEYPDLTDSDYCAKLYERYGMDFVKGLNSNFAGVVYDTDENQITLFTDRLSARPIFYARPSKDSLVFSTSLQSIANHHSLKLEFDMHGLYDFFKSGIVYGLKTALKNVKQVHPGGTLTINLNSKNPRTSIYWRPNHTQQNWPYDKFVDEFYKVFKQVISEQTAEKQRYGLLLSGGSDSRLIANFLDENTVCHHMNENINKQAETAKNICENLNLEFNFLKRNTDYYPSVLDNIAPISNLNNWFEEAHTGSFVNQLREKSDCIINGSYADTLLGCRIPTLNLVLPILGDVHLPILNYYSDIISFNNSGRYSRNDSIPSYLKDDIEYYNNPRLKRKNRIKGCDFHGVKHSSFKNLLMGSYYYYPVTNTYSFFTYYTLVQTMPVSYPFLDNRVIKLILKMPLKYLLRKDIVKSTLCKNNKKLANIPKPKNGLTLCESEIMHLLSRDFPNIIQKLKYSSIVDASSWPDHTKIIQKSNFAEEKLQKNSKILKKCSFISEKEVWKVYNKIQKSMESYEKIYPLLTFLENPISQKVIL